MKKLKLKNEQLAKEEIMFNFVIADSNYKKFKKERNKLLPFVKEILEDTENDKLRFALSFQCGQCKRIYYFLQSKWRF